jgi:hypothetical protein
MKSYNKNYGGALVSGDKEYNDPCSEGTWFKKSCSDGLVCITVPEGERYTEGDKTYDGYCAPEGTNPDSLAVWVGGRKSRSNKGKKRGAYGTRVRRHSNGRKVRSNKGKSRTPYGARIRRHSNGRKVRSNKGKSRSAYGPRTGKTRSGKKFRG